VKNLQLENPIDEHLKPVKDSDGTSTSVEISTDKIRVNNLEVIGTTTGVSASDDTKLPLSGGTMSGSVDFGANDITNVDSLDTDKFSINGGTEMTGILDEDDMSHDSATALATQQSIKAYVDNTIRDIKSSGFNYSYTAGTKVYIPLGSTTGESSSTSGGNEWRHFVVPFDGYLDQVVVRSEEACGSTIVGLHKSSTGTELPNTTASTTVTVDMTTDDTAYKFDFTSSNTFSAGDIIAISFDPTNDANDTNATTILVYDGSQGV